jgi:beta-lactamase regulating signal transducer with metallopeptidase domain
VTDTAITLELLARAIGSALVHSLWQGMLIAGLTAVLMRALRGATANTRYLLACLGLAAMAASWAATAVHAGGVLAPALVARAANPSLAAVELGPAGPLDFSRAIRILPPEALERPPDADWAQRLEAWSVAAVPLWLAGVLVLSARLGVGWLLVERLRRSAIAPVSDALAHQAATLAGRMRMRRAIRVMQSAAVQVPTVIGWLRPVVLLPMSALTGLTPEQIASILAHELAHIRRHDYLVNVLQSAAEVLLFSHPACWWLSRRIRVEREHCCDDVAIAVCGDRLAYASALADLESLRVDEPSLALGVTDGPLVQRVRRLIAGNGHGPQSPGWAVVAASVAVIALVFVSAQMTSRAATVADLGQTSVPTAARVIPADEGVAEGRVVEFNSARPVAGATVLVAGPDTSAEVTTDVEGRFEAARLKPGSYRLSVRATGYVEAHYGQAASMPMGDFGATVVVRGGVVTRGLDVRLQRAGSVSGRVTDAEGKGLAGIEIELIGDTPLAGGARGAIAFAQTTEDGTYQLRNIRPGDYVVRAYASREAPSAPSGPSLTYASTFYPGVPRVEEAQRLRLDAGQELLDVDFPLGTTRRFRVSGRLIDPSGELLGDTWVMLHRMGASGGPGSEQKSGVDKEGRFEIRDVVPDTYMVNVFDRRTTSRWVAATLHLTVDADVTDLELRASLGAQVEGRVVKDASATRTLDTAQVRVGFEKSIPGPWGSMTMGGYRVVEGGRFSVESPGGPVQFKVMEVPSGWMVKSISLDGTELDDGPIDLGSGRRQIEIVLTDKVSGVSGVVVDRNGNRLANYSVVVFPADRSRWRPGSRFVQSARSNNAGQFRVDVVPPGEYLTVALAGLPVNAWQDPAVLERLERSAERIRVIEGQRLTISIRASPTPEGLGAVRQPAAIVLVQRQAVESPQVSGARASERTGRTRPRGV